MPSAPNRPQPTHHGPGIREGDPAQPVRTTPMPTTTLTRILDLYALLNLNPHDASATLLRERIARLCLSGRRA